jgi:hypothetical protein
MSKIKLTPRQREILSDLNKGVKYYFNSVTSSAKYTKYEFGGRAISAPSGAMEALESRGFIEKKPFRGNVIYSIYITEKGKEAL